MPDGAGGLEGRGRPSKGLQRKDATVAPSPLLRATLSVVEMVAGASRRSAELATSVLKRDRGEAPVEYIVSKGLSDLRNDVLKTLSILSKNVYGWFTRVGRGLYAVTPKEREVLSKYPELVRHYRSLPARQDSKLDA